LRHKAIASNIANIGTTGYKAKSVRFEEELSGAIGERGIAMSTTSGEHEVVEPQRIAEPRLEEAEPGGDGIPIASGANEVDIDTEMAQLAQNQIRFKFAARLLGESFRGLQKSIRGTV
jgi:flagellar basal-body rod protein FlgB